MRGRAAIVAVVAGSCGRVGFDRVSARDAPVPPPDAPAPPVLVTSMSSTTGDAGPTFMTLDVPVTGLVAGDLLVVGITDHHGVAVAKIVDASGTALLSTNGQAVMTSTSAEIWYEPNSKPTTQLTITMSGGSNFDVFVAAFSGLAPGPPDAIAANCLEYPPDLVTAPVTTTVPNELVFSATMFAYPIYVADMLPPFTGFPPVTGNDAGYYIAPAIGSYGTTFDIASGSGMAAMTCASSASWRPAT
jgi:hypothetical protein